jgi:phenylalanine-4-hydroxylase
MHSTAGRRARRALEGRLPEDFRRHLVAQKYEQYGAVEHQVWCEVLARNEWLISAWENRLHPEYIAGMRALELPKRVPRVEEINERLQRTGWQIVCVDGYIPSSTYAGLMSASLFPMSRRIRRPEHVDYAPEPDLVHDVIGHLPMLFSPQHREFLRKLATVMRRAQPNALDEELYAANRRLGELKTRGAADADVAETEATVTRVHRALQTNASELTHLGRMYLWSVEFGLTGQIDDFTIYGAALMSSPAEFTAVCEGQSTLLPYSLDVIHTDIAFTDLQKQYFVAHDFAHLEQVLNRYEGRMDGSGAHRIDLKGGKNA